MQKGDFVIIDFIGRLESGEIFDLTKEDVAKKENIYNKNFKYRQLPVIVGAGFLVPGLDKALLDINVGEKREVTISTEDGFGDRDPKLVRVVPMSMFKERNVDIMPGMVVDFGNARGRVQSISSGRVRVDFNNPLAGKALKYEVEIKEKIEGKEAQIKAIFDYFDAKAEIKLEENDVTIETKLPPQMKEKISSLIKEYVGIGKVKFLEVFLLVTY